MMVVMTVMAAALHLSRIYGQTPDSVNRIIQILSRSFFSPLCERNPSTS